MECFQEPCVLLKYSPITTQHHQPVEVSNAGRKKKSFWKWPFLHFPRRKTGKYDLVKAEKQCQCEPGVFRRVEPEETHGGKEEKEKKKRRSIWKWLTHRNEDQTEKKLTKAPKVSRPAGEEQREQDVQGKGHILKKYKIGPRLGEGGFGFVHAGIRRQDGLQVAVKFSIKSPNMEKIKVPGHKNPLPAEIALTLMANTGPSVPQIIRLLDWEDDTDHFIMVLERPEPCMDMFSFLELRRRLDEKTARDVLQQVVQAANVSCERGVFHRDIKLENLLLNPDTMEVKLIDFGCGALMRKTAYTVFAGTKEYFPPEFYQDGGYHAKPMTVWGLGILLFTMVCGALPSACDLHMSSAKTWSSPGLSRECCKMICDCLQPDPQERLALEEMPLHDWFTVME